MTKEQIKEFTLRTTQENHSGLVVVLFDIELVFLKDATEAYENDRADDFVLNLEKARRAHNELMSAMNTRDATGLRVLSILRYIYKLLVKSVITGRPCETDRCIKMLGDLREGFVKVHENDRSGPVMKNTHQVYAGLTYGRGTLNESYGTADYSNRGFKA